MLSHNELVEIDADEQEQQRLKRIFNAEIKKLIEAVLFTRKEPVSLKELSKVHPIINKSETLILTRELMREYFYFTSALEIVELTENRFEMRLKTPILNSIEPFTQGDMFRKSDLKTLSVIIFFQPTATKKKLRKKLGTKSTLYTTLRRLKEFGFIEEINNTFLLTQQTFDYFKIKEKNVEELKKKLMQYLHQH